MERPFSIPLTRRADEHQNMLTKKGKYGLKAMVHLAGYPPGEPSLVTDIATANSIPKKFLDTILGELRNAGFVNSKKGKGGGYTLARSAQDIRVGHIIRVLDGPLAPIQCASRPPIAAATIARTRKAAASAWSCWRRGRPSRGSWTIGRWPICALWP